MKKIFVTSAIFVLLLAASVFAFTRTNAANENSCPLEQSAQSSATDYSKVVVAKSDEDCCQKGADCCKGGVCCKRKRQ